MNALKDYAAIKNNYGKFEGETGLTNWYWHCVMNGDGEDHTPIWDGLTYTLFTVDYEESQVWPEEVKIGDTVVIWEDSQGFVNMVAHPTRERALKFVSCH